MIAAPSSALITTSVVWLLLLSTPQLTSAFVIQHTHSSISTTSKSSSSSSSQSHRLRRQSNININNRHFSPTSLFYQEENDDHPSYSNQYYYNQPNLSSDARRRQELANSFLQASRSSFRNVEGNALRLLDEQPLVALLVFAAVGLLVAYVSGFIFLNGYISSTNPIENGAVPYWDDGINTILEEIE